MITRDEYWYEKANQVHDVQNKIKELTDLKKDLVDNLIKLSEGRPSKYKGVEFKLQIRPGAIKYKDIPELKFIDLEKYRDQEISFWKLYKKY